LESRWRIGYTIKGGKGAAHKRTHLSVRAESTLLWMKKCGPTYKECWFPNDSYTVGIRHWKGGVGSMGGGGGRGRIKGEETSLP